MATGVMVAAVLTLLLLAWARVYRRVCRALKHAEDQVRELRGREAELRSRERDLEERIYEWRAARSSHPPWLFPSNPAYQERFMAGFIDYMDHPISLSRTPGPPVPPSLLAEIKKISQQPITLEPDKQPEPHTTLWDHLRD